MLIYLYIIDQWRIVVNCPPAYWFTPHSAAIKWPKSTSCTRRSIITGRLWWRCNAGYNCRSLVPVRDGWRHCEWFRGGATTDSLRWKIDGSRRSIKSHPLLVTWNADLNGHCIQLQETDTNNNIINKAMVHKYRSLLICFIIIMLLHLVAYRLEHIN